MGASNGGQARFDELRDGDASIDPTSSGPEHGADDLQYILGWFEGLATFWQRAADGGRAVIFTVDA